MATSVVNVKVDSNVKKQAQKVVSDLGLSLSSYINGALRELIRTKTMTFSLRSEQPSEYLIKTLKESEADRKAGRVSPSFDNVDDAIAWLENPKSKYANQIRKKI